MLRRCSDQFAALGEGVREEDAQMLNGEQTPDTITSAPQEGTLLLNGSATSSFTQAEINNGQVSNRETGVANWTRSVCHAGVPSAAPHGKAAAPSSC